MNFKGLIKTIQDIHKDLQASASRAVNISLTLRNWTIGYHIVEFEQKGEVRASYGQNLFENLENELKKKSLSNISQRELRRYRHFYMTYSYWLNYLELNNFVFSIRGSLSPIFADSPDRTLLNTDNKTDKIRETASPDFNETNNYYYFENYIKPL